MKPGDLAKNHKTSTVHLVTHIFNGKVYTRCGRWIWLSNAYPAKPPISCSACLALHKRDARASGGFRIH